MNNRILIGNSFDPWRNLALEELLFVSQPPDGLTLYLWQNQNTVVIGKHQNAWRECRTQLLEQEGGRLARRSSGGGAVFHDLGNLNFTFLAPHPLYQVPRQKAVIQKAVSSFGIRTCFTGRNDLVVDSGEKFSGNAFRQNNAFGLHHGTLLVDADLARLARYLAPSPEKLASKGVKSVRSRVVNLKSLQPSLSISAMKQALCSAFEEEYTDATILSEQDLDLSRLPALQEKYASWEWRMGKSPSFGLSLEHRFEWGSIELHFDLAEGNIQEAHVYSDAMDEAMVDLVAPALIGARFSSRELARRLRELCYPQLDELADFVEAKGF